MIDRVVLDVELAHAEPLRESMGAHERREARMQSGSWIAGDGKQFAITPEALGPAPDELARQRLRDRRVVVGHLERSKAFVTHPQRSGWECGLAEMAAEMEIHVRRLLDQEKKG